MAMVAVLNPQDSMAAGGADRAAAERYAALYVRVSTGMQRDNWSVDDQYGLARLGEARGLPVVAYDEQGVSGETIEDRPTMQRLLADIEAGKVAAVIAVDWNRLSRDEDLLDGLRIKKACKDNDALVLTPSRTYDFSTETDGFLAQLEMMFAASQKQKNIKAMTRGAHRKFMAGKFAGGIVPFGYRLIEDDSGGTNARGQKERRIAIHHEEAKLVRRIFELYADGLAEQDGTRRPMSQQAIGRHLNDAGYRVTLRFANAKSGGGYWKVGEQRPFESQDITRILQARYYLGIWTRGEGRRPLSKYVRDLGPAEATLPDTQIVDVALWQRAQAVREARRRDPAPRSVCANRPLAGLLRCDKCGGLMHTAICKRTLINGKQTIDYSYGCLAKRKYGRCVCEGYFVSERAARRAVEDLLISQLEGLRLREWLERAAEDEAAKSEGEIAQGILLELQQTDDKLKRLVAAVADGVFTAAEARNVKLDLLEKKERLQARLAKLRQRADVREELREAVQRVQGDPAQRVRELDGPRFRQLARMVLSYAVVVTEPTGGRTVNGIIKGFALNPAFEEEVARNTSTAHVSWWT